MFTSTSKWRLKIGNIDFFEKKVFKMKICDAIISEGCHFLQKHENKRGDSGKCQLQVEKNEKLPS